MEFSEEGMTTISVVCPAEPAFINEPALFPWYGIRTKSNFEKVTARALASKGYEQYLPLYRMRTGRSDHAVEIESPLFRGYVFCRFDFNRRLPILITPGVISVITMGTQAAVVPESEIEAIRAALRSGLPVEPCAFIREGQHIRIDRGPLEGVEGILVKKKSNCRIVISAMMLQRSISVELDGNWISKV